MKGLNISLCCVSRKKMVTIRRVSAIILVLLVFVLFYASYVSAFSIKSVTPQYINRSNPTIINFTINNTDEVNITRIVFTLPMESRYYLGGNGSGVTLGNATYTNGTAGFASQITLTWTNTTRWGIIGANETKSFWFNATLRNIGTFFTNITIDAYNLSDSVTSNSYDYNVNFGFSGFVKNETGGNESNVNISVYKVTVGLGPPVETLEASVLSTSDGSYSFPEINGTLGLSYKLRLVRYGPDVGCRSSNASCNATKIGPSLPQFPAMMYYPSTADLPEFLFMRPPSLNGTSFYLGPAATLRLYAHNLSLAQRFGYQVVDQVVGFPTESNVMASVTTADVIVPIDRNFTVMFSRFFSMGSFGFAFSPLCDGSFMNNSLCPTPPLSNSTLGPLTAGQILIVNQSLIIGNYRLSGCIDNGGVNNSNVNITAISLKMVPWTGFVPPTRADRGDINVTTDISYNLTLHSECNITNNPNGYAWYNISVMGASGGINYLLEIYAKNTTTGSEVDNPGTANNLAVFQNITINAANKVYNLSMRRLAGGYYSTGTSLNTSQIKINILNSTGGAVTNKLNANVKVKNPAFGTMNYIIEDTGSGAFYVRILNNSNWAKIMVFANDAPPKEISINLSSSETNITIVSMWDGRGVGMKKINESGDMAMINSTQLDSSLSMNMRFLRNSGGWDSGCNVLNPADSCSLTSMQAKNFNPLDAMLAGKVNMEMKMASSNVTMTFINFDMFSAKQPPMDSIIDDAASGAGANQNWQFGSFAPPNTYDYVIIGMPYNDTSINDSANVNITIPSLYDENWKVTWNQSAGSSSANLSDDFIAYNDSLYRNYLASGGLSCDKSDATFTSTPCYMNTTSNMIYMKIPHFSGVAPTVSGSAPASASSSSSSSSSSGGGGGGDTPFWKNTYGYDSKDFSERGEPIIRELREKERIRILINGGRHHVGILSMTSNSITINVSSTPQQADIRVGETKKFEVTSDDYYDISVFLGSLNETSKKANLTISYVHEKMVTAPTSVAGSSNQTANTDSSNQVNNTASPQNKGNSSASTTMIIVIVVIILIIAGVIARKYNSKNLNDKVKIKQGSRNIKVH